MEKMTNLIFSVLIAIVILDRAMKGNRSISDNGVLWIIMIIPLVDALIFYLM